MSKVKTSIITYNEFVDDEFTKPSNYYYKNALGEFVFIHSRSREVAQQVCDDVCGKGQYKVNASRMSKNPESQSAVGRINSKSRAGMRSPH